MTDKTADLAGPGIGNYVDIEKVLPANYRSVLSPKETQRAIFAAKQYICLLYTSILPPSSLKRGETMRHLQRSSRQGASAALSLSLIHI